MLHENFVKEINEQSRALALLSNGKIYYECSELGYRIIVPDYLKDGLNLLLNLFSPHRDERGKTTDNEINRINTFFKLCQMNIYFNRENGGIAASGKDYKKLGQFLKSCIGFGIPAEDVYF